MSAQYKSFSELVRDSTKKRALHYKRLYMKAVQYNLLGPVGEHSPLFLLLFVILPLLLPGGGKLWEGGVGGSWRTGGIHLGEE